MSFLSKISLANKSLVALATIAILLLGGFVIPSLKEELFPSISFPSVSVIATYPGASPSAVEKDVTTPLEQSIEGLQGIQSTTSYSNESSAVIVVSYNFGTDLNQATQDLTQQINKIQSTLPSTATTQIQTFSVSDQPIISLAVSSDADQVTLAQQLKQQVVPSLEKINGVGTVNVTGVRNQIVDITVDPNKLKTYGISITQIQGALAANNISVPAGEVTSNGQTVPIVAGNTLNSLDELKNLVVGTHSSASAAGAGAAGAAGASGYPGAAGAAGASGYPGAAGAAAATPATPVKLSDVATVQEALSASTSLTRTNGKPSLGVSIVKTSNGNTVSISHDVNNQIASLEKDLGSNAKITVISDQAPTIESSISDLIREGLIGAVFAIIVILVFLLSIRSTLVTAVSIPLSIIIALIGLYIGNYTLNILTLGGLTIAIGRVVDDSIVVLENIYRHLQKGEGKNTAIPAAVREVAGAVTASTLTTVAVFLPIAFTSGIVGALFSSFAVAVTISLLASLFVALTIIPVLAYWFLKSPKPGSEQIHGENKQSWFERGYVSVISWVTDRWWQRTLLIVTAVIILIVSLGLATKLPTNLFGSSGSDTYSVRLTLPPSSSLSQTNSAATQVENAIHSVPNVKYYQVTVGSAGQFASLTGGGSGSNDATFSVTSQANADQTTFLNALTNKMASLKNLGTLTVSSSGGGLGNSSQLEVDVNAADSNTLQQAASMVYTEVAKTKGIKDLSSNLTAGSPQIQVNVDATKAASYGLTAATVGSDLRMIYSGSTVSHITLSGSDTQQNVDLYLAGQSATSVNDIKNLLISTSPAIKVSDVADVSIVNGPTQVTHINGTRTASITADITAINVGAVSSDVQQRLNKLTLPTGASFSLGGVTATQSDTFRSLGLAVLIAIILVYCIMVATFRSLLQPIILMISIPFAATGSILLSLATNTPLGATSLIGFLMLVGIVVTNAIVLLDLVNQYRKKGLTAREAVIEGGRHRLRPILMTAIATILALMPMALGVGGSSGFISGPLAVVVIGGLITSTILTLILVPTLYVIVEGGRKRNGTPTRPQVADVPTAETVAIS